MAESNKNDEKTENTENTENTEEDNESLLQNLLQRFARVVAMQSEEVATDPVLPAFDLPTAADFLKKSSKIIVMAGAGISTSAGIPDFRTPGTGLYSQLEKYKLPYPEAIFSIDYFRNNPKPFFTLAKELYPQKFTPTPTHFFLRLLQEKEKLLRIFTQNIDALERIAGVDPEMLVEAHGTFFSAHCISCRAEQDVKLIEKLIFEDQIPTCSKCEGFVKPDIVFFGEGLPSRFHQCVQQDLPKADFLIILGTSLKVAPFNRLVSYVGTDCPRLLINMEPAGTSLSLFDLNSSGLLFDSPANRRDVFYKSSCDDAVFELAKLLGWEEDFKLLLEKERKPVENPTKVSENAENLAEKLAQTHLNND